MRSSSHRWIHRALAPLRRRRLTGEEGYNLVALVVMIAVMNIVVAKALPLWSGAIQRDKEQEFIFRGIQYAEAIRVFEARYQRPPTQLEELIKSDRRCIRQLWDNPLVESKTPEPDGEGWIPVFDGQPATPQVPDEQQADGGGLFEQEEEPEEKRIGPIIGVRSKVQPEMIQRNIPNWQFTKRIFEPQAGQIRVMGDDPNQALAINAEDIGRLLPGQEGGGNGGMQGTGPGAGQQVPGQGFNPSGGGDGQNRTNVRRGTDRGSG